MTITNGSPVLFAALEPLGISIQMTSSVLLKRCGSNQSECSYKTGQGGVRVATQSKQLVCSRANVLVFANHNKPCELNRVDQNSGTKF